VIALTAPSLRHQERDAFDVVRHREQVDGAEREHDPLPTTVFIRGN